MLKIFLVSLFFCPMLSFAQAPIDKTGSNISVKDARAILDHHNKIRNDLHIPSLSWNAKLAAYAQDWADSLATSYNCNLIHRSGREKNSAGFGENIYFGGSAVSFKPLNASLAWYNEIRHYRHVKLDENNWLSTGHYTQMIWKSTKEIGVGIATCATGGVIVVANYNPPGNYMGEYPY